MHCDFVFGGARDLDTGNLLQLFLLLIHAMAHRCADRCAGRGSNRCSGARIAGLLPITAPTTAPAAAPIPAPRFAFWFLSSGLLLAQDITISVAVRSTET